MVMAMFASTPTRRAVLGIATLPLAGSLGGCATPLPLDQRPQPSPAGAARFGDSAQAHGLLAYRGLSDINVSYDGAWRPFIEAVQPVVVDAGFRGRSQERLLPAVATVAQAYSGPRGAKQVLWQRGRDVAGSRVAVWFNGRPSTDEAARRAAAVVAECYGLFLLGPLWLAGRQLPWQVDGTERVDGRLCDVLQAWLTPGLGLSPQDRVTLCIDRDSSITRRMRFTLEGYAGTQGAVAETDTFEHARRFGVLWPMRSYERVAHPISLPAHDWHITGLDVNRGYGSDALAGPEFSGAAAAPATAL